MKTEAIKATIKAVRRIAEIGLAGKGLEYDALKFVDIAHAADAELALLEEENERLRKELKSKNPLGPVPPSIYNLPPKKIA